MKKAILKIIIALIFLATFNLLFFFGGLNHSDANWCSYGFITFSYICLLATPILASGSNSAILIGSLWLRASTYFFIELIVGTIFIAIDPESMKWPLIVQSIMLAIFLIYQLMGVLANDSTTSSLNLQKEESFSRQILIDQLKLCVRGVNNPNLKPILNRCVDTLSNTPIQSFPDALEADLAVSNAVNVLCSQIDGGNPEDITSAASKMLRTIQERNLVIKRCHKK